MNKVLKVFSLAGMVAGAALTAVPAAYSADDAIDSAIKARRGLMQLHSHYAGPLFAMAKGDIDYDAALAANLAENLNAVVNLSGARMWPPESDNKSREGKTRAQPAIWQDGSDIGDKSQAMKDAALAATMVAGDGLDALRGAVGDIGQACKGCHDDFRAKDF